MAGMDKKELGVDCTGCSCGPTDICWPYQNKLNDEWRKDNPYAEYEGWMSI